MKDKLLTPAYIWSFLSSFLMFFSFYLLLPILPLYLITQFHAGKSLVGIILSSYTITALFIRPFGGYLVDSLPRKGLLIICYCLFVAFFGGYILATTLLVFAILRALHGVAFGMVTISNSTVAIDVMPASRRNEGIGYYALSTNLAMAAGPTASLFLFDSFRNYTYVFMTSLIAGIIGIICAGMIKTVPIRSIKKNKEPISLDRFFLVKGLPCALIFTLISFSYGILTTYVAIYGADEVGLLTGTGMFFAIFSMGLVSSRLLAAGLMKAGKLNKVIFIGVSLMIAGYGMFIFLKTALSFYFSAFTLGISYGYVFPAFQAVFVNLATHNQRGTANSSYYISGDLGIGIGVLAGGYIADLNNYTTAYITGLGLVILGGILYKIIGAGYYEKNKTIE
ncbi:MAG: MFS transporter [Candidatus Azobacteroides sp.]|nr:MFS transporter [Candidatus Azobacteroides sp.]